MRLDSEPPFPTAVGANICPPIPERQVLRVRLFRYGENMHIIRPIRVKLEYQDGGMIEGNVTLSERDPAQRAAREYVFARLYGNERLELEVDVGEKSFAGEAIIDTVKHDGDTLDFRIVGKLRKNAHQVR